MIQTCYFSQLDLRHRSLNALKNFFRTLVHCQLLLPVRDGSFVTYSQVWNNLGYFTWEVSLCTFFCWPEMGGAQLGREGFINISGIFGLKCGSHLGGCLFMSAAVSQRVGVLLFTSWTNDIDLKSLGTMTSQQPNSPLCNTLNVCWHQWFCLTWLLIRRICLGNHASCQLSIF